MNKRPDSVHALQTEQSKNLLRSIVKIVLAKLDTFDLIFNGSSTSTFQPFYLSTDVPTYGL